MKKTVTVCNNCGNVIPDGQAFRMYLFKDRKSDGVEYNNYYWEADLCPKCLIIFADKLMKFVDSSNLIPQALKDGIAKQFGAREI